MAEITVENLIWTAICWSVFLLGLVVLLAVCYKKPDQGQALIRHGFGGMRISFSGLVVLPLVQKAEFLDITLKRLVFDLRGTDALTCKDGIRADVQAAFFIRIEPTTETIQSVVRALGIDGASDVQTLRELFGPRFLEVLNRVANEYTYTELSDREFFKDRLLARLDVEFDGYMLNAAAIDYFAKSPH